MSTSPKDQEALRYDAKPRPTRQPVAGEQIAAFVRGHDRYIIELRDDRHLGVDVQVLKNEEFLYAWRRPNRELAEQLAGELQRDIESGRFNP